MNNQKRILEVYLYILLLGVGLFLYFFDIGVPFINNDAKNTKQITEKESELYEEVPSKLIDYDFRFEGD